VETILIGRVNRVEWNSSLQGKSRGKTKKTLERGFDVDKAECVFHKHEKKINIFSPVV
jgi:hypothetical protein